MGGQYRKVGARIVVSSLLATSLGLSVLAMAPAANAVEIPMCENIGQPGISRWGCGCKALDRRSCGRGDRP